MENRRETYRHSFEPEEFLRAEIHRPGQRTALACEVLNLSLGGIRARLRGPIPSHSIGEPIVVRLLGRNGPAAVELGLSVPSQVVHLEQHDEEWHCGIYFLPLADARANDDRERTLSRFLLAEQRRRKEAKQQC